MARPAHRPGNLPAEATSFIGRRRELTEVRTRLTEARLVCLVGPGGVGKTRVAVRAATDLARGFPGGAWLVELADVRDPALVGNAVVAALDLRDQTATEPVALLRSYLRDKRLLLVLDNCEHVLGAAARLVTALLRAAPDVRVIATSREPLSAPGEHLVPLAQLRLNEAVQLFVERAAARSGRFELTDANRAAVVELCRRLDGLPLAIELAAVRTRVLSVPQILARLTDRFGLLVGGGAATLPRHQTLRTTIDWSHDLLTAGEQALLRRLCVFAGRFTLDDVEGVCDGQLDLLSSLVDKSLVVRDDHEDVACFRLHETMREYASHKLVEAGEAEAVELRCADYYRDTSRRSLPRARYRLAEWLDWMDLEIDNVRAVLQRCVARGDSQRGLDLAGFVGWYWVTRATSEGIRWLDELLATCPEHALGQFTRGFLAILQADPAAGRAPLERAAALAERAGHRSLHAQALSLASIAAHVADRAAANRLRDAAEAVARGLDDYPAAIAVLQTRALCGLFDADLAVVRSVATEGIRRSREAGDLYALEMMLTNLGVAALIGEDPAGSRPLLVEALQIARRIDDRIAQYTLLDALGCLAAGAGQPRRAARLLGAAETARRGVGATVLPHLAPLLAQARQAIGGEADFDRGRRMSRLDALAFALEEPAGDPATPAEPALLSKREAEVAALVAEGLSNKQIALRLLISEHTVDSHVRSILTKLGVRSRTQIVAWLASATATRQGPP